MAVVEWGWGRTYGTSSTGRASVSKTEGWGFKSLVPCSTALVGMWSHELDTVPDVTRREKEDE